MAWPILIISGVLEAVWATALHASRGFKLVGPSIVFGIALVLSMAGLAFAMTRIPPGTSYVVWTGIGATLTVIYAMATGAESASILKCLLLAVIVGCVVTLKFLE